MKKIKSILFACSVTMLLASCGGGYYVAARPAPYTYVRPVSPYAGAIWIGPEYYWSGSNYAVHPGYWGRPRPNYSYHPGHWNQNRRGHAWVSGGWRRR